MPTVQSMDLPLPKQWQEFEKIVRDAQALRWNSAGLQMNGRPGQKQAGVDIFGPDEIGRLVGVQCKRFSKALTMKEATDEISKAEKFKGRLSALYLAITGDHDSKFQGEIRELSDKRVASGQFAVATLYWDEIVSSLLLNPAVFKAHYPQFQLPELTVVDRSRVISAFDLGYYESELWELIVLILGEFGQMAQEDPDQVRAILRVIEHQSQQLLPPEDASVILEALGVVRQELTTPKKSDSDWDPVEDYSKRISSRVRLASSLLPLAESNALELGVQLARIYHHCEDLPAASVRKDIEVKIRSLIKTPTTGSSIKRRLNAAAKATSAYRWTNGVYGLINHELRFGGL